MSKRGRYPKEFKLEAVRLLDKGDKPASELAMELGVKRTLLYRWRDQINAKGEAAFNNGKTTDGLILKRDTVPNPSTTVSQKEISNKS